jgi:hypothetical protein
MRSVTEANSRNFLLGYPWSRLSWVRRVPPLAGLLNYQKPPPQISFSGILSYSIDESSGDAKMLSRSEDSFFCENVTDSEQIKSGSFSSAV